MNRLTIRFATAILAFLVGISAAAWVVHTRRAASIADAAPPLTETEIATGTETGNNDGKSATKAGATLEMVFVLDTTGSMGGLLEGAKQRIWGIVNEVMQSSAHPNVRIGLVAYRDRGDEYVTQVLPLTDDLDRVYATLMEYQAAGGGDGPENVRRALADAVNKAGWSKGAPRLAQIIFLVGDAPPHDDYRDEPDTTASAQAALNRNMNVNTIQCGQMPGTREVWQKIARAGHGEFFAIAQDGGVDTIATPYDERISQLGTKLGGTFTAYGGGEGAAGIAYRAEKAEAQAAMEANIASNANMSAVADRAYNKVLNKQAYKDDLLQSLENGEMKLGDAKEEDLPDDLRKLSPEARRAEVDRRLAERRTLRAEIIELSRQRDAHIAAERKKRTGGGNGFDTAVAEALRRQLASNGIK